MPMAAFFENAESLAARAHAAAIQGESRECLVLLWSLRDLPREQSVRHAVDRHRHAAGKEQGEPEDATTLLQATASVGCPKCMEVLLEVGPSIGLKDGNGRSALHVAVAVDQPEVVRQLLARGRAPVDSRDARGRTPLRVAADLGHHASANVLMYFGAQPYCKAADGQNPYQVAAKANEKLANFMKKFQKQRKETSRLVGRIRTFKALDSKLPAHVCAPPLKLTGVGFCPEEDGKVVQLKRGIRNNKSRAGPSNPPCRVNWYSPRG